MSPFFTTAHSTDTQVAHRMISSRTGSSTKLVAALLAGLAIGGVAGARLTKPAAHAGTAPSVSRDTASGHVRTTSGEASSATEAGVAEEAARASGPEVEQGLARLLELGASIRQGSALERYKSEQALRGLLLKVSPQARVELLLAFEKQPAEKQSLGLRYMLRSMVATLSPVEALELARREPKGERSKFLRSNALTSLAANDPDRALEWMKSNLPETEHAASLLQIVAGIATADVRRGLRFIEENITDARDRQSALGRIGFTADLVDPEVRAALETWPNVAERFNMMSRAASSLARIDAEAALRWIESWPPEFSAKAGKREGGVSMGDPLTTVYGVIAAEDPQRAWALASAASEDRRSGLRRNVIRTIAREDLGQAVAMAQSLDSATERRELLESLTWNLGWGGDGTKPVEVFTTFAGLLGSGSVDANTFGRVAEYYAKSDPAGAAAAVATLPLGEAYERSVREVTEAWAAKDPNAALTWLGKLPDGSAKREALGKAYESWAKNDPVAALQSATALADERSRSSALREVISEWASKDPIAAGAFAASQSGASEKQGLASSLMHSWGAKEPEKAAQWLTLQQDADLRLGGISSLVDTWSRADAPAVSRWMETLPAGADLDRAIDRFTDRIVRDDPEGALTWASKLSKPEQRAETTRSLAEDWFDQSPAEARPWIERSTLLTPEQKQKLLERGKK